MVSELTYPRQESVGIDWVGNPVSVKSPNLFRPVATDCGGVLQFQRQLHTVLHRRWQELRAQALHRPAALSRLIRSPTRPYSSSGYGGGPDRCVVKVPDIVSGKIPKPASISGKMTKSMVRYEEDASDPTAVWRVVHLRPSEKPRNLRDLVQPAEWENEKTRRSEDLRLISLNSTQGNQLRNTPEGNFDSSPTGYSVVVTGWEQDQVPNGSVRRMEWENPDEVCVKNDARLEDGMVASKSEGVEFTVKEDLDGAVLEDFGIPSWLFGLSLPTPDPIQEPTLVKQWPQSPKEYLSQPHSKYQPRQWNPNFSNERVHNFYQQSETNLAVVNNPDEAKFDLAQLYMGKRVDRGLRSTGLRWILPPWPDFCMGDSFTQHSGYEVIENFYSVKHYNHSVLDYTEKFEELIKIWPIVNEDYYARVEGREIISNPSKAVGLATMSADKRSDFDNFDEYVRNTIARAFSVIASTLDISALLPFLKVVCQSKKVVQQIVILMGCTDMPHLKFLFEIIEHSLSEENQEVKTITALSFAALAETASPYGIESFDTVLKPLWKGIRYHLGKILAAYLKTEKPSIDEIKLTLLKPFELIASMKNGTIRGKIGKEILDELIAKGGIVKSMMEERDLVQIADPAAIEAMDRKNNFCNMPVIAHVDHGKSALADSLVTAAGIIAQEVAGDVHMTNICADEAERGTTIKSTVISLFYEMTEESLKSYKSERDGNEYIINLIDSPGHVDNSSEVTATLLITYGVLVVVDCIEGVSAQTETVLCHALGERIRPVLTVNIMDRGFLELQVESEESYQTFSNIIENAHVIMATYEDPLLGDTQVYPEKGIVAFSAGLHGWVFTLSSLAKMYASKLGVDKSKMIERLWGENYFDPTTKKWTIQHTGSATCKRGFVQFYYEPIKQIIKICVNDQKDKWWPMLRKLGVTLKTDEKELMAGKVTSGLKVRILDPNYVPGRKKGLYVKSVQHTEIWMRKPEEIAKEECAASTELTSAKVYASPIKLQVFTFAEAYDFKDLEFMFQEVATGFKTKVMFIYVDIAEENLAKPFLIFYDLKPEKPTVTSFDISKGAKYLIESDINVKNLREFCLGLLDVTLPSYFRSELVPQEMGLVEKVVRSTFNYSVLESPENVLLEVYVPWCVDCEAISKNREKMAKHFSGLNNLKSARIDAAVNEHFNIKESGKDALIMTSETGSVKESIALQSKDSPKENSVPAEQEVDAGLIRTLKFSVSPVVRIAVQCQGVSFLPKLVGSLKCLAKSGELICAGVGELHLEICLKDRLKKLLWRMLILSRNIPRIVCPDYQTLDSRSKHLRTSVLLRRRHCQNLVF